MHINELINSCNKEDLQKLGVQCIRLCFQDYNNGDGTQVYFEKGLDLDTLGELVYQVNQSIPFDKRKILENE